MNPNRSDEKYLDGIRKRLGALYNDARSEDYDPASDRIVVFSDHHRGSGDGADDFRRSEHAYSAALGFYFEAGYRLFLLGDTEELWEVPDPDKVFDRYGDVLGLERRFTEGGGLERFWGNHDDRWANAGAVKKELSSHIGGARMQEGLKLRVARPEGGDPLTIFFAHGHQGTPESDRFSMLARLPVRYIWPLIQRFQHATATTPARDHALRGKHDSAMFHWAREEPGRVLVAGHTHRPVFARSTPDPPARSVAELEAALDAARSGGDAAAVRRLAIELEYAKTVRRRHAKTVTVDPPCYFNTGCCSFPDGDITGIELADGEIRLVRWPANLDELRHDGEGEIDPEMRRLKGASESLDAIARAVSAGREGPGVQEHDLVP